jgi:methyl-accepting chemotaxis protein
MRFTIKLKLGLTFAVVIVLSGVTAWLGISNMAALDSALSQLVEFPVKRLEMSQQRNIDLMQLVRSEKNLVVAA